MNCCESVRLSVRGVCDLWTTPAPALCTDICTLRSATPAPSTPADVLTCLCGRCGWSLAREQCGDMLAAATIDDAPRPRGRSYSELLYSCWLSYFLAWHRPEWKSL